MKLLKYYIRSHTKTLTYVEYMNGEIPYSLTKYLNLKKAVWLI